MKRAMLLMLTATFAATIGVQGSASATTWVSPFDQVEGYYMPGPPPGGYLSACYVQSMNGSNGPGPIAMLNPQNTTYSSCSGGHVAVFFQIPGGIGESASLYVKPNTGLTVAGPDGDGDIGGAFNACNIYAYCLAWDTTWISGGSMSHSLHRSGVDAAFNRFLEATARQMPRPTLPRNKRAIWVASFTSLARCMRQHGVGGFPNPPTTFGDGRTPAPLIGASSGNLDVTSAAYIRAFTRCPLRTAGLPRILMSGS